MIKLVGYQKQSYVNKEGKKVEGVQLYFVQALKADDAQKGFKPWLSFNQSKKQLQNWFVGNDTWLKIKASAVALLGEPVQVYFNEYGNICSISRDSQNSK